MVLFPAYASLYSVIIAESATTDLPKTSLIRFCILATGINAHPKTNTAIKANCQEL